MNGTRYSTIIMNRYFEIYSDYVFGWAINNIFALSQQYITCNLMLFFQLKENFFCASTESSTNEVHAAESEFYTQSEF